MLVAIIIMSLIGVCAIKKAAIAVYQKTGKNTLKGINKFLWYVEGVAVLLAIGSENTLILVLGIAIPLVLQFLICMKAGIPAAIIMAVLHCLGGAALGLLNVIVFLLNLCLGKGFGGMGSLFSFDESAYEVQNQNSAMEASFAETQKRAEEIKREEQERADAYAQHQGFRNAEEAERLAGIKTGRPQD